MKNDKQYATLLTLFDIFKKETDETHPLSTIELQAILLQEGIHADRRTIYKCIASLQQHGYTIIKIRSKKTGYYLLHDYSLSQAYILSEAISTSTAFSLDDTNLLLSKLHSHLSTYQVKTLPTMYHSTTKSTNKDVLHNIETILQAIHTCSYITFQYYDITVTKQKKYRRNNQMYQLTPYAIVSNNGKYYCVIYDHKHQNFTNYRIDKMEHVQLTDQLDSPIPFSLDDYMRNNMQMYHGTYSTIRIKCALSLASQLFDQFGTNVIISQVDETTFTANIKTTLSPTLTSWLLLFYNQIEILYPQSLLEEMLKIGEHLCKQYKIK